MNDAYIRKAYVERVIDGDTVILDIDVGFRITTMQVVRLAGINAPEMVGEHKAAGVAAKGYLQELLPVGVEVTVKTYKPTAPNDRYGRYVAYIMRNQIPINSAMVEAGHAVYAEY